DADRAAMAALDFGQQPLQLRELRVPRDERVRAVDGRGAGEGAYRGRPGQLVDLHRVLQPLYRRGTEGPDGDALSRKSPGARGDQDPAGFRHLLHARREMGGLPDSGVIHVQVVADGAHDDLTGMQADADMDRRPADGWLGCVLGDVFLDAQRGET